MTIPEKIRALQDVMEQNNIDIYYIPTNDFHGSEYVDDYFKCREYLSGFTGSAGSLLVSRGEVGLWTDGRYFLQAEEQLQGSGITLYRMREEGVPTVTEFVARTLSEGQCLGFDGRVVSADFAKELVKIANSKGATVAGDRDLVSEVWRDRPALTVKPAFALDIRYAGVGRGEKICQVRRWLEKEKADMLLITSLDDIAWLLNIRGGDIHCSPVVLGYLIVDSKQVTLFARREAFGEALERELREDGVAIRQYDQVYAHIEEVARGSKIAMDLHVASYAMLQAVPQEATVMPVVTPTRIMKAKKNPVEVANMRRAHIQDGIALVRFICWLKRNVDKLPLTELSAAEKLEEFRAAGKGYMGASFDPIMAYGEHGAIVHYSATPETDASLLPEGFLLMDTGGHYLEGTTDVTRTVLLGSHATWEQKKYYTAVLRGNLRLAAAKFRYGCSGVPLDYLARGPLWEMGCDYNHGTGHGVGYFLNVHEGPNAIRYEITNGPESHVVLEEGMITSNEPGIYLEGRFGVRLENLIACQKREKTEYGQFMGFETLTMVPFDRDAIAPEQMTEEEKRLLNHYHETVYETISPYLDRGEAEWLKDACAAIS